MKDLIIYYFLIILPVPVFIIMYKMEFYWSFIALLLFYALIYRPIIDGLRLKRKGIIEKKEFWKCFIPSWRFKYSKELYY